MTRHFPAGYIGTTELLSRLGGSYRKSSIAALVASGRLPGERTPGGHWRFRDDLDLAKAVIRLRKNVSGQRRARRAASQPNRHDQPSADDLATVGAFVRVLVDQLLAMYFDGRDLDSLGDDETAELERRFLEVRDRIMAPERASPSAKSSNTVRLQQLRLPKNNSCAADTGV